VLLFAQVERQHRREQSHYPAIRVRPGHGGERRGHRRRDEPPAEQRGV